MGDMMAKRRAFLDIIKEVNSSVPQANALSIPPGEYVRKNETQRN